MVCLQVVSSSFKYSSCALVRVTWCAVRSCDESWPFVGRSTPGHSSHCSLCAVKNLTPESPHFRTAFQLYAHLVMQLEDGSHMCCSQVLQAFVSAADHCHPLHTEGAQEALECTARMMFLHQALWRASIL